MHTVFMTLFWHWAINVFNERVILKLNEAEWRKYASVNLLSLVLMMACPLAGTKPLLELILEFC